MTSKTIKRNTVSDILGTGRIAMDGIAGITDLVEDLHQTIAGGWGIFDASHRHRTRGITGMVYRTIHSVYGWVGGALDTVLETLAPLQDEMASSPGREAWLAALNGVLGDHLAVSGNPLAIPMTMRREGVPIDADDTDFSAAIAASGGKLAVMVHGLCMNDLQWRRQGHDHGEAFLRDLGYTPVYLHYNTGLHVSENGRLFSELMESFTAKLTGPIDMVMVTHSMGGLVARSACHYGRRAGHGWIDNLQKLVFLGTPHHGSPWERGGSGFENMLGICPYSSPFARLGKIRSSGITDLRYGNIIDAHWNEKSRFGREKDTREAVPLPVDVECYAVGAVLGKPAGSLRDYVIGRIAGRIGDGLVPLYSALGCHANDDLNLFLPADRQWIGRDMAHLELLNHADVYRTLRGWLAPDKVGSGA